jgi:GNAT superfamily N-acetyltransferase
MTLPVAATWRSPGQISALHVNALEHAVVTLERAFFNDPMFAWIFPDAAKRSRALSVLNRVPLRFGLRHGHVMQSNDVKAVALWLPPGRSITWSGVLSCGILRVPFRTGLRPFAKFAAANEVMGKFHKQYVPEPHWYLMIVGVDPDLQGRGLGSALINEGLARADQARCPCYLETSDERNVAFYERFGFKVVGTAPLGKGGPPGWAMRRAAV